MIRGILGLVIGVYLTVALVVAGGGVYGFLTHQNSRTYDCSGQFSWAPYALIRAAIWPKAWYDERLKTTRVTDWLVVKYDPFPTACR